MNVGLSVVFDGKSYMIPVNGEFKSYPIGGLICEMSRLHPTDIKHFILDCPMYHDKDLRNRGAEAMWWLYTEMSKELGPVIAAVVVSELTCYVSDFNRATPSELTDLLAKYNEHLGTAVCNYILEDTEYESFGVSTLGQALLSAYSAFVGTYAACISVLDLVATDGASDPDHIATFQSFFVEHIDMQHIDYKIVNIDGSLQSIYTMETFFSLTLFEAANVIQHEVKLIKCKNCNRYFVPVGRSDSIYCGYEAPGVPGKTCREIGAKATRARMMKNDTVTQEYRRLYMRLKMAIKRHPDDLSLKSKLQVLTDGMKEKRRRRDLGEISADDILEWIASIDGQT